jgi:hypothetical protein
VRALAARAGALAVAVALSCGCALERTAPPPVAGGPASSARVGTAGPPPPAAVAAVPTSQVRAFVPTRLVLPSGREAAVHPAGVGPDGALDVPQHPAAVGWWTGGARVRDPFGSVVLAGHVDSRRFGVGAMAELLDARVGDLVQAGNDAGAASYRVERVLDVPKADLVTGTDVISRDGPPRLVLVTCGGAFDPRTHRYADNHVVVATAAAGPP